MFCCVLVSGLAPHQDTGVKNSVSYHQHFLHGSDMNKHFLHCTRHAQTKTRHPQATPTKTPASLRVCRDFAGTGDQSGPVHIQVDLLTVSTSIHFTSNVKFQQLLCILGSVVFTGLALGSTAGHAGMGELDWSGSGSCFLLRSLLSFKSC